jgi:uncharacterized protein (TIGR03435 family)
LISGGPAWIDSDRWDIAAKAEGDLTAEQMMPMLQALLEDRFKLKVHRETKEQQIYALAVASSGVKLQPLKEGSCANNPRCGAIIPGANGPNRTMDAVGMQMDMFVRVLSLIVARPVIDKSGLTGPFDAIHLEYAFGMTDTGPSIFTSLHDQLGLKLESTKGPVEVLVIDHVEKPSAN